MTNAALRGKPDAGNPHVRFDEGEVALAATPRRGSLLYTQQELSSLGEGVRKQGYEKDTMQDLVYNAETGEFEQRQHSEMPPESGIVVTEMTREGFAHE